MQPNERGFILIMSFLVSALLLTLVGAGLARSVHEADLAQRHITQQQAFYLAEAGLDAKLAELADSDPANDLSTGTHVLNGSLQYEIRIADPNPADAIVPIESVGSAPGASVTLRATIELPLAPGNPFTYTSASDRLNLDGHATVGDMDHLATLYVDGGTADGNSEGLITGAANELWLSHIDFYNPNSLTLEQLCPNCSNPSIFHPGFTYNLHAARLPDIRIDLTSYYQKALEQDAILASRGMAPYHHVTSNTTLPPGTVLEGVIYVECGKDLTVDGSPDGPSVIIRGTIVHEGCGGALNINPHGALTIDSNAETDLNNDGLKEAPFAKGMAIVGSPAPDWGTTTSVAITGFIMVGSSGISTTGTIDGGLVQVRMTSATTDPELAAGAGPGQAGAINFRPLQPARLGGTANLIFNPLTQTPPGVENDLNHSSSDKPVIRCWQGP
ncbi:MAG: hypothetical protein HYZ92_06215 [Candidatus Omnitrophica bacterium]|nr:hypothetical protein [Candidatus Omnitrophota bacterium]